MLVEQNTSTATYLIWARDASHGGFAYPFTSQLDFLSDLPFAAERLLGTPLAAATRAHLAKVIASIPDAPCQIHLPFLDRQELSQVSAILLKTHLVEDAPNVYRLERADQTFENEYFRQCLILMAPALFPAPNVPITAAFSMEKTAMAGSLLPWLPDAANKIDPQEQLPVKITVTYTESASRAWANICPERTKDYVVRYGRMSVALRRALRFWVPMIHFAKPSNFQDTEWTWPLLGWASTKPQHPRTSRDFTYDVLDAESMSRASRSMRRNLHQYLAPLHDSLNAIGESLIAEHYGPKRHVKGAYAAEYNRRNFNALFAGEHYLVEILNNFGTKLAVLRDNKRLSHSRKVRLFHKLVKEFCKQTNMRLRRFFGPRNWESLAPLLLLEITNSLAGNRQPLPITANGISINSVYTEEVDLAA